MEKSYKCMAMRIRVDWSVELLKYWEDVLQVIKDQRFQIRLLFSRKISTIVEGEIRIFLGKCRSKKFVGSNPTAQRIQERVL